MTHHLLEKKLSKSKPALIRQTLAVGVVALMFQGSSSALTSAWAAGCVENPNFCVVSTGDDLIVVEDQHTLRSAVASANAVGRTQTIGFADELFGITRTDGVITGSSADANNPVVITLQSTLEIRSDLTIKAPTLDESQPILKIARGTEISSGSPLIAVNPTVNGVPANEGATTQVAIENVIIDSNANPNSGGDPRSTPGVAIEVKSTLDPENPVELTPELVVKNSQIVNGVSDSGGAAINTPGNVVVENSSLISNMAITPFGGGPASSGGAILAGGTVTVAGSTLSNNSATGDGGAIAANAVVITSSESGPVSQLNSNTAGGNGGAIASTGTIVMNENYTEIRANVAGGNGGALSAGGTVTIGNEVSITDNHAGQIRNGSGRLSSSSGGNGGAISASGTVTVTNTTLSNNSAQGIHADDGPASGSGGAISSDGAVIVQGSVLNENQSSGVGGAIYGDTVTVESALSNNIISNHVVHSEISGNYAQVNGGGIFAYGPVSVIAESQSEEYQTEISENQTGGAGGAIFSESSVTLENGRFLGNVAGGAGGAISTGGEVDVTHSRLVDNHSGQMAGDEGLVMSATGGNGGAIHALGAITITQSEVSDNSASYGENGGDWGDGGAIKGDTVVTIVGSTLEDNHATGSGGAISADQIIIRSTDVEATFISGNYADFDGGGISALESVSVIAAFPLNPDLITQFLDNEAGGFGGAIHSIGPVELNHAKITGSAAQESGGGLYVDGTVTLENSILNSNAAGAYLGPGNNFVPTEWGGSGGAIFATDTVTVINSSFQSNSAFVAEDGSGENGDGGAIYSASAMEIIDGIFKANEAGNNGGAIFALGPISITGSEFGSITIENPDYNPIIGQISNSDYDSTTVNSEKIENSNYNPRLTIRNELYNISVPPFVINLNYGFEIDAMIPNPLCVGSYEEYDGQCFLNETDRGDGERIRYPITIPGRIIDERVEISNPEYDERQFFYPLLNPSAELDWRRLINNPNFGAPEFIDSCELESPCDDREEIELGNTSGMSGGAIYVLNSMTIDDSTFQNNNADGGNGGAIYLSYDWETEPEETPYLQINDSRFSYNSSSDDGGAIQAQNARVSIRTSTFENNESLEDDGGALDFDESNVRIAESTFTGNAADDDGGSIQAWNSDLELRNVTMIENSAVNEGGAIDLGEDSTITIMDSLFEGNAAGEDGGAIDGGTMRVTRTTFLQNTSGEDGGALWVGTNGQSVILNSIFSQNVAAEFGGAIYGPAWLMFNDFVGNSAATASAIALTGRLGTMLVGNILEAPAESETSLCNIPFWNTPDNLATDESCFSTMEYNGIEESFSQLTPDPYTLRNTLSINGYDYMGETIELNNCPLISCWTNQSYLEGLAVNELGNELMGYSESNEYSSNQGSLDFAELVTTYISGFNPLSDVNSDSEICELNLNDYYDECLTAAVNESRNIRLSFSNFEVDEQNITNLMDMASSTGEFLRQNFAIDRAGIIRPDSDFWTVGAIQSIVEDLPVDDSLLNQPPVLENNNQNNQEIRQERRDNTESATERALRAAEDAKRAAELAAAKLAKKEAAAKRAAERKAKLSKVSQKMAATKARGAALKQKIEWINLMKNFVAR